MLQIASLQASEEMTTATQARLSMKTLNKFVPWHRGSSRRILVRQLPVLNWRLEQMPRLRRFQSHHSAIQCKFLLLRNVWLKQLKMKLDQLMPCLKTSWSKLCAAVKMP